MDQLKLKYIIQLVSDVGPKAKSDAEALGKAQEIVQRALGKTNTEIGRTERLLLTIGRVGSASAERQAAYLGKLALRYHDVRRAAEGAVSAMGKAAQIGAGVAAGGYAADRMTQAPMDYSMRLARMANTAFADRNAAGRVQGKGMLDAAITAAVRTGGGTRDDAAAALDDMIASSAVPIGTAIKLLPQLMKGASASGATAQQLGGIGVRAMQSFGIKDTQFGEVLNMAMSAGQAGGFELKDMAKYLPEAMGLATSSGLSGMEGLRRIIASMQAGVITAGTKDQAGNNLINLLGKLSSPDTTKDFGKALGVDLPTELVKARKDGINSLDAFVALVDKVAQKNPEYVALKAQADAAGTEGEKAATLKSMADILQGSAIGQVMQDRQAIGALVAEMNNRGYIKSVMDRTRTDTGSINTAFDVVSQETSFKREQAAAEVATASSKAFAAVAPAFDAVYASGTMLAREFPLLSAAAIGATGALGVFAAALGGSSLLGLLRGGAGGAAGGLLAKAGGMAGVAAKMGPAAAYLGGAAGLFEVGRLGWAAGDWWNATHREGVKLTPDAQARLAALGGPRAPGGADYLSLTNPNGASVSLGGGIGAGLRVGDGKLDVNVKVTDDRVSATSSVTQPMSLIRINPGNTNPAGYPR